MTESATTNSARRPKGRSPSYPAINLEAAVERARQLYERERQHPASVETIRQHWGYRSLNGPASLALAALRKFDLLDGEGAGSDRRVRLTDLAVDILANPDPNARLEALRTAALSPPIHRDLWEKYGDASDVSDSNLHWELTRDRGFTETGASEFVPEYRSTIQHAQLTSGGSGATQEVLSTGDKDEFAVGAQRSPDMPPDQRRRPLMSDTASSYAIPLASGVPVVVEGSFPISERDWTQLLAVLTAMKPGLVTQDDGE